MPANAIGRLVFVEFTFQSHLHQPADLELDGLLCRNRNPFQCLRILRDARRPLAYFKDPKITKLEPVARLEFRNHVV